MALPAYRHLLRSITITFRGDTRLLTSALSTARSNFEASRSLSPSSPEATAQIAHAEEVAEVLRKNVVQGQATDGEKFRLRIHDDIERGSNETIGSAGKGLLGAAGAEGGCCGGGATPSRALR
ncbi:MAG: hypothetical protein L6R39_003442 [Caloplaca ligustica]|nr:MAG: hypothetical protein L6R39_003442 [Caloplaca ligustica]